MSLLRAAGLLRPFLAVARTGNLSAAARELAITQPALTKSVRKLERQFGVALFERKSRGMALTPSGTALLAHARAIEAHCRVADSELDARARGETGSIRLGAGTYWGNTVMPQAVAALQQQLPGLEVTLEVGVYAAILARLFAGELDLVVGALPELVALPAGIERRDFMRIHLRVVAGTQHPLHRRTRVSAAELARYPWVLYQHDRDVLDKLAAAMRRDGAPEPRVSVETSSLLAVMELLRSGPYLACVADAFLRASPDLGVAPVRYLREIWTFPSGALFHSSLRDFPPIRSLLELVSRRSAAPVERAATRARR